MGTNTIKKAFSTSMKKAGFGKKSDGWYLSMDDTILVVNLQKSNFGEQYYINLAVWLNELGQITFPKEYQCHIRTRATLLEPERQKYWEDKVFNLENTEITEEERLELVQSFLENTAIPFLLSCGEVAELKRLHQEGQLKGAAVMANAQKILQS